MRPRSGRCGLGPGATSTDCPGPAASPSLSTSRRVRYITFSREAGAGGSEIAAMVGRKLGWEVLDKNLLDQVADRFQLSRPMLELVDETSTLGLRHGRRLPRPEDCSARKVPGPSQPRDPCGGPAWQCGPGGPRGAFLLPRENGLAVRIVASMGTAWRGSCSGWVATRPRPGNTSTKSITGGRSSSRNTSATTSPTRSCTTWCFSVNHLGPATVADLIVEAVGR